MVWMVTSAGKGNKPLDIVTPLNFLSSNSENVNDPVAIKENRRHENQRKCVVNSRGSFTCIFTARSAEDAKTADFWISDGYP